jgi:hypothetical protein
MNNSLFKRTHYPSSPFADLPPLGTPAVISQHELETEARKRLKRLLMVRTGMVTEDETEKEVLRYPVSAIDEARQACEALVKEQEEQCIEFLIMLKVVAQDDVARIPNFKITSSADIDSVFTQVAQTYAGTKCMIWFSISIVDPRTLSLGGRLTLPAASEHMIELVWHTSPRSIEMFTEKDFAFPFWRARRPFGGLAFRTECLYIPRHYLTSYSHTRMEYEHDAYFVNRQVWQRNKAIQNLCEVLYASGAKDVTLEFRVQLGVIRFIDWDTDNYLVSS